MPIYGQTPPYLGETTFANRANLSGTIPTNAEQFFSDIGPNGTRMRWTGTLWVPTGGDRIYMGGNGIPLAIPPGNGSTVGLMGNNGAISALTGMPMTLSSAYIYLPANAIYAGSAAGFYYFVGSSATAGTVYQETYNGVGKPVAPTSPTPWVTTGPGYFTQSTSVITMLAGFNMPGNLLGNDGELLARIDLAIPNNTNNKTVNARLGASIYWTDTNQSVTYRSWSFAIKNMGSKTSQIITRNGVSIGSSSTGGATTIRTIDTSTDKDISIGGQLAVNTDYIILLGSCFEAIPA